MTTPTKTTVLYNNLATSSSMYSCTNVNSSYPASNLYGYDLTTVCRSQELSVLETCTWTIDLGSNQSFDTIAIAGSNLDGQTALGTYRLQVSRDTGSTSYAYINPQTQVTRNGTIIYYWEAAASNQYVRVRVSAISSTISYVEIGVIWVGLRVELGQNPQIPIGLRSDHDTLKVATSGGQTWMYDNNSKVGYELMSAWRELFVVFVQRESFEISADTRAVS